MPAAEGRRTEAQVTVFLALSLTMIFALLLGLWESARTQGSRLYFTQALNSAMDSLFSQYHRTLWDDYRLLGLEHYADMQLREELEGFMMPYFSASDWYPQKLSRCDLGEKVLLTDRDGEIFEKEVLAYMKYGAVESLWSYMEAADLLKGMQEALSLDMVSEVYQGHAEEAVAVEEAMEDIMEALAEQERLFGIAEAELESLNGGAFINAAEQMQVPLRRLPELISVYGEKADALQEKLSASRAEFEAQKSQMSREVSDAAEQEIREYEAYTEKDGARRQEIEGLSFRASENLRFIDAVIREAEEVEAYIAAWVPEDEDDYLDEAALWAPVEAHFQSYDLLLFGGSGGIADKEKEGFLERIGDMAGERLLELVLPEGMTLSRTEYLMPSAPSETCYSGADGCRIDLLERVMMGEYTLKSLHYFGRELYGDWPEQKGSGKTEVEYVLNGKKSDYENMQTMTVSLLAMREGLNLVYLFTDAGKRAEARQLAELITGALCFTPIVAVVSFFVLAVWALGQALCDVRDLLSGKAVPLRHDRESFYLTTGELLGIGAAGRLPQKKEGGGTGLLYREYLRIFLFKDQSSLCDYRIMDVIQMNIQTLQKDFLMNRCIYSLELSAEGESKHLLSGLGLLRHFLPIENGYRVSAETFFSY